MSTAGIESVLLTEPEDEYHAKAGEFLSSHLLGSFRDCPEVYHDVVTGVRKSPDTSVFTFGRAFHVLVLEGLEEFQKRFTWEAPVNLKTGKPYGGTSQKYQDWVKECRHRGQQAISLADVETITKMACNVAEHKEAKALLDNAPYRERVIRLVHPLTYNSFKCQTRMDAAGVGVGIVDLKSCKSLSSFPYDADRYGYFNQLAFYRRVLELSGLGFSTCVRIIAVEKMYPYRCGVWQIRSMSLDSAQEENEMCMEELKKCQQEDVWPTRYEEVRSLSQR